MNKDIVSRSVTKDDTKPILFQLFSYGYTPESLPDLSVEWTPERDMILRGTIRHDGYWATAIHRAISRVSAKIWEVEGDVPLRVRRYHELFLAANTIGHTGDGRLYGQGWDHFLDQHLRAFLLTDLGAFVEVVYKGGRVIGFVHLDPARCYLTGDASYPVIYHAQSGCQHEMPTHTVFRIADMMDESSSGIGQCAAFDVYDQLRLWAGIQRYYYEKVIGKRAQRLSLVGGVTDKQLKSIQESGKAEADARGVISYMGVLLAAIPTDQPLSRVDVDLMGLPDNFNRREEWEITTARYASRLNIDPQDLSPQRIGGFGSGGQARVWADKANMFGLVGWRRKFLHQANIYLMDAASRFVWTEDQDPDVRRQEAEIAGAWGRALGNYVDRFILTPEQALQVAADHSTDTGITDRFLQHDTTSEAVLQDTDRGSSLDDAGTIAPVNVDDFEDGGAEFVSKEIGFFHGPLSRLVRMYRWRNMSKVDFEKRLHHLLRFVARQLYKRGVLMSPNDVLPAYVRRQIDDYLRVHLVRVPLLADAFKSHAGHVDRPLTLFVSKLKEAYVIGQMDRVSDPLLTWRLLGDGCADCKGLDGESMRASEWRALGLWPHGDALQCGGTCQCLFEEGK